MFLCGLGVVLGLSLGGPGVVLGLSLGGLWVLRVLSLGGPGVVLEIIQTRRNTLNTLHVVLQRVSPSLESGLGHSNSFDDVAPRCWNLAWAIGKVSMMLSHDVPRPRQANVPSPRGLEQSRG